MRGKRHLWGRCGLLAALIVAGVAMQVGAVALDPAYEAATRPQKATYCDGGVGDGRSYCWRNCTSFVAYKLAASRVPAQSYEYLGHAKDWITRASARGIASGTTPKVGAVAYWTRGARGYGHVAWVDDVHADGSVAVSSYNGFNESYQLQDEARPEGYIYFSNISRPKHGSSLGDAKKVGNMLLAGGMLRPNRYLQQPHSPYALVLQPDGNLVLYKDKYWVLWHSRTYGTRANRLVMQGDGNLVLYAGRLAVWHTQTHGRGGAFAALQGDGNFVVYTAKHKPLWHTGTDSL